MNTRALFQKWDYRAKKRERIMVYPDGCRDVLIIRPASGPISIVQSLFDFCPRCVVFPAGTEISGYRLRPGLFARRDDLQAISANHGQIEEVLGNLLDPSHDLFSVIEHLGVPEASLSSVSRQYGVSSRTMQRRFSELGLPAPDFWRLLGRARHAVLHLGTSLPLAEIACACGYSDQAHMTRDLVRWFGESPANIRQSSSLLEVLSQPALGGWTGEQISTR